jgi:hypothetical protein
VKISVRWLKKKNACSEGVKWFEEQEKAEGMDVLKALISDGELSYANWLVVRLLDRPGYLAYAIFSAEQVIDIFESKYPGDKRPRQAIEAAKAVLENDTHKNRDAASAAASAASSAAASASYYADYAAASGSTPAYSAYAASSAAASAYAAAVSAFYYVSSAPAYAAYAASSAAAVDACAEKQIRLKSLKYGMELLREQGGKP